MAGFDPAEDASRRRVLAPRVSGRSRDRRHRHYWTGTHAGWRSAQREIAPAQLAGRRPPAVPMVCVPAAGMNLRPCRRRRRQCDAGAGERQRRTGSARTGCSVPLSRSELAIDRQRIVGRAVAAGMVVMAVLTLRSRCFGVMCPPVSAHGKCFGASRRDNGLGSWGFRRRIVPMPGRFGRSPAAPTRSLCAGRSRCRLWLTRSRS